MVAPKPGLSIGHGHEDKGMPKKFSQSKPWMDEPPLSMLVTLFLQVPQGGHTDGSPVGAILAFQNLLCSSVILASGGSAPDALTV